MSDSNIPSQKKNKDPLHGVKLAEIVEALEAEYGWDKLGEMVKARCFLYDPSVKSSLKFLRRTPWARTKIEGIYLKMLRIRKKNSN